MYFVAALVGLVGGAWLFSENSREIAGAILGAILGVTWLKQQRLQNRLEQLERQQAEGSNTTAPGARTTGPLTPPKPAPAETDFIFELEAPTELAENPAAARIAPPRPQTSSLRTPQQPITPRAPHKAPLAEKPLQVELWNIFVSYFTGGNVVVRAGAVVLFFGVAFLLKYSAERNIVPIELRLLGVSLGAMALLVFGWRLRHKRTGYALILQGAAVGILYLVIFSALRLYQLLPASIALALLVGLSLFSAALAVLQNARVLVVIGLIGGFLAPLLTSTGGGSHVMLFSYYALLNVGILLTAWHKSWRELNLLGFIFTFGIGTLWGAQNYRPEMFATTEPFLALFFLFYLAIGILFARNLPLDLKGYIDGTLVFGTPIVCFGLQAVLVKPYEYGLAWSALIVGGLYAALAWALLKRGGPAMRTVVEAFMATGVVFATVAIPLALDGRWTSAAWALEGSAIVWIALKQQRWMPRIFGLVLQVLAGAAFLSAVRQPTGDLAVLNGVCLGGLIIAFAGFFSGYCLHRQRQQLPTAQLESTLALGWALLWWFGTGLNEIETFAPHNLRLAQGLSFCALSSALAFVVGIKLRWEYLKHVYKGLLPVMLAGAAFSLVEFHRHPSIHGGWLAWPLAFLIHYALLRRDEQSELVDYLKYLHLGLLLLLVALTTWEATWWTDHAIRGGGVWPLVVLGVIPALFVLGLCRLWNACIWPLNAFQRTYLYTGLTPIVVYLWLGSLATNLLSKGNPWPLSYLPLFNPLDLTQAFVLLAIGFWMFVMVAKLDIQPLGLDRRMRIVIAGVTVFFWLNAILIRTLHYWGGVRFHPRAMVTSDLVQTSVSIFWTLSALVVMLWAARKGVRLVWMVGAGLIGVVIVKLFIFDLANTSTVERIVSFIGVGVLCLVIGYLAPLPPKPQKEQETP
jgi:uncharacterized membrane protein